MQRTILPLVALGSLIMAGLLVFGGRSAPAVPAKARLPRTLAIASDTALQDRDAPAKARHGIPARELSQTLYWYDGERRVEIFVNPEVLVEFDAAGETGNQKATALADAELVGDGGGVRLWRVDEHRFHGLSTKGGALPTTRMSPLLHTDGDSSSPIRALPGGVLVRVPQDWTESDIELWRLGEALPELEPVLGRWFRIPSEVGLASLELANRLYESGLVERAQPDWWTGFVER